MGFPFLEKTGVWKTAHRRPLAIAAVIVVNVEAWAVAMSRLKASASHGRRSAESHGAPTPLSAIPTAWR